MNGDGVNLELVHQAPKAILDRDLAIALSDKLIKKYSPYLKDIVNWGTGVIARIYQVDTKDMGGSPRALKALYHHVVQMTDAIEVLVSNACFGAMAPLLRSQLEGTISLAYILDDDYESRSDAWMVDHYLNLIKFYESQDESTIHGREFRAKALKDKFVRPAGLEKFPNDLIQGQISEIKKVLRRPQYIPIVKASKAKKGWKWHYYKNGPASIADIFARLRRPMEYEILYRRYSEISHARDCSRAFAIKEGTSIIPPVRRELDAETECMSAGYILINATRCVMGKFRPEENIQKQIDEIVRRHRPEALRKPVG